ncbi:MAG: hypothetical protein GC154_05180 [bacterium]|nr:hypothetical protein [bacterium]
MKVLKFPLLILAFALPIGAAEENAEKTEETTKKDAIYAMDFSEEDEGFYPLDFLVLEGDFEVVDLDGDKALMLPGMPLSTMGFLYGPTEYENRRVSARIKGENEKRRYPRFGIGLCGVNGYKLRVTPSKRALELYKGDEVIAETPYKWTTGKWTNLVIQLRRDGAGWVVEASAWQEETERPEDWMIRFESSDEPINGRPTAWGTPYSGHPIYFDDLILSEAE